MSTYSCSDVCEIVYDRLKELEFDLDGSNEDHTDIIEALNKTVFVKDEDKALESESPELREARTTAEEVLRIVTTRQDHFAESFREYVGDALDLSDDALLEAWETIERNRIGKEG